MGATNFLFEVTTHDIKSAFAEIVEQQTLAYGYSNDFNKTKIKEIYTPKPIKKEKDALELIHNLYEQNTHDCCDKWSETAYCIKLDKKQKVKIQEVCGATEVKSTTSKVKKVWATVFSVKSKNGFVVVEKSTRKEAIDFAKAYAQKENKELIVEETKKNISGNSVVSTVSPKYKSVSKDAYTYLIFGIRPE